MSKDDFFVVSYKILQDLSNQMEIGEYEPGSFTHVTYGVSRSYWERILTLLFENGYIDGIVLFQILGRIDNSVKIINPQITIKGLEYLEENSTLQKAKNFLKDLAPVIP